MTENNAAKIRGLGKDLKNNEKKLKRREKALQNTQEGINMAMEDGRSQAMRFQEIRYIQKCSGTPHKM